MKISHEDRLRKLVDDRTLSDYLLSIEGISSELFDETVGSTLNRMNLVGTLRSNGFDIRGGHGSNYRVLGWEKPVEEDVIWTDEMYSVQAWIESLPELSHQWASTIEDQLSLQNDRPLHECCYGYLWSYEAVGNKHPGRASAFVLVDQNKGVGILQKRFSTKPRLRIVDINLDLDQIASLIPYLEQLSFKPIEVRNLTYQKIDQLTSRLEGTYTISSNRSHQSLYNTEQIAQHPESFFSKKSWKSAKKNLREVDFRVVDMNDSQTQEDAVFVVDKWKKKREATQLRLAIGRDYVLLDGQTPGCIPIMGYRGDMPVSLRVLSSIPMASGRRGVADLVEKSFNYSSMPGGHSGMSDAGLVASSQILYSQGYSYINGGESASVSPGLVGYKDKFEFDEIYSEALIFSPKETI